MTKRIILCCDGTWNEPETMEDDRIVPTNVLKMVRAVEPRDSKSGTEQIVFYDQGVGTGALGVLDRSVGGGTGFGISKNIQDCYRFLANNYVVGDEIFLFGFSRGAYTVRSLSGLLATVGVLEKDDLRYVPQAYEYYHRDPQQRQHSPFHALLGDLHRDTPKIKFIGVWDTVGALGIPTPILGRVQEWVGNIWKRFKIGFHDCNLSPIVENACQALAIDEHRGPFRPSIWDQCPEMGKVRQVWFAGVHSNIGGGYSDAGLSDLALIWMVNRARECGLLVSDKFLSNRDLVSADEMGKLEDSYSTGYKILEHARVEPYVRPIGQYLSTGEMIHESVIQRIKGQPLEPYRPVNVVDANGELKTLIDQGRECVDIDGVHVPIFKERAQLRISAGDHEGMISLAGQGSTRCQIIDFTQHRGARLRVFNPVKVGENTQLDSDLTGAHEAVVVWSQGQEIGVRFVA